jgi:type II secretory pathway component PulM
MAGMTGTSAAALQHIRQMEARVAQQTAHIVELRQSGQDTLEAARRLALLHHALEEMRLLIGNLVPTEERSRLRFTN